VAREFIAEIATAGYASFGMTERSDGGLAMMQRLTAELRLPVRAKQRTGYHYLSFCDRGALHLRYNGDGGDARKQEYFTSL
jgi:hypothetical protein